MFQSARRNPLAEFRWQEPEDANWRREYLGQWQPEPPQGLADWIPVSTPVWGVPSDDLRRQASDDGYEVRARAWAQSINPIWQGVFTIPDGVDAVNWAKKWVKLWENVAVAHVAGVEMKEVIFDAKSNQITNKAAILAGLPQ